MRGVWEYRACSVPCRRESACVGLGWSIYGHGIRSVFCKRAVDTHLFIE